MWVSAVPWILFTLACAGLAVVFLRLRAAGGSLAAAESETARLKEELRGASARLEKKDTGELRRRDELQELKRKLEKAKKRAARAREDQHDESSRTKDLERDLEQRASELRSLRAELASRSVAPVEKAEAKTPTRPAGVAEVRVPPQPAPAVVEPPPESEALAAANEAREAADARARKSSEEAAAARKDATRLRERVRTQDKLYLAIHGELQAKKDRLRQLTEEVERLRAYKVAVLDPQPVASPTSPEPEPETPTA